MLAAALSVGAPLSPAHAAPQVERTCVVNRTDGVITHRYVLVYRMTDAGKQTNTERKPRRDYPAMWSKLCGPNGALDA